MRTIKKILMIFAVLLVFAGQASAFKAVEITSVNITPSQPLDADVLTFNIFGTSTSWPTTVAHDLFSQNGTSLQLDLYMDGGVFPTLSNWSYSKQVQPLSAGTYSLEVRAFDNSSSTLIDSHTADFSVAPKPSTLAILGFAWPFLKTISTWR